VDGQGENALMTKSGQSSKGQTGDSPVNIARHLGGIDFPASKQDLVKHAQGNGANDEVMDVLNRMPDREYGNMADVMKGFGESG
jgi:hypothetical protein